MPANYDAIIIGTGQSGPSLAGRLNQDQQSEAEMNNGGKPVKRPALPVERYAGNHRDLALRIPLSSQKNTRVEHRVAGADPNPYLVSAALLAGIHHGIVHRSDPGTLIQAGPEIDDDVTLPIRWELALREFEAGQILPGYLGEEYHKVFASCRREESDRFHEEVSNRDYEWYMRAV